MLAHPPGGRRDSDGDAVVVFEKVFSRKVAAVGGVVVVIVILPLPYTSKYLFTSLVLIAPRW